MDELNRNKTRPTNPRRRKRSQAEIFKEVYLPVIIAGIAVLLILIFIIGSIVRAVQRSNYNDEIAREASIAAQEEENRLRSEMTARISQATALANHLDYAGALDILNGFSGNMDDFLEIKDLHAQYTKTQENLVLWNDPNKVLNLSFQMLIAEPSRTFNNASFGSSYNRNFITTQEFSKILQQLYENGYVLVKLEDVTSASGPKDLYLPKGKKPLILTQTNVNYYTYMIDSDNDKLPDKNGAGFASKLVLDANGKVTCQMVNGTGNTVTGAFDLVPILDAFVESHPDFSYKGAKAILAVSGYDGVFGYRTSPAAEEYFGKAYHNQEVSQAKRLVDKLRKTGYEIACYTYENEPYGSYSATQIKNELSKWNKEVAPILGQTDIFVFSRDSDIASNGVGYSGDKFNALKDDGYCYFIGFSQEGQPWYGAYGSYIRQARIIVSGSTLAHHPEWFNGMFDPSTVLDPSRGTIPS